ncbi:MAG: DUF935 family protein [Kiritimatiellia bacterium]
MAKADPLKFNAWTLGGRGADVFEKSAEALELERLNPLRGVDEWRLGQIFDDARDGIYADLAWLYHEIEGVEPALLACCDMRESAASECGWLVKTSDAKRVRGFDQSLADEQRDALLAAFGAVDDDLAELAGHLTGAFFRGAAHARALWNADGSLAGFQHLDLWNFALDKQTGLWYWNADASRDERSFQAIPPGELVTLCATRHVDHAALPIFIRAALGAKRYGVWLDRFGIPPVAIIMPPNAERGEQAAYMDLARKFARGGSGILPAGTQPVYGTEARAMCPFTDFIRFQQQQIYTVGIGRVQSGETDAANLGGNAAGVVENGFQRLVRRDARRIARAVNDAVTSKILARLFPGRPALAQFAWDTETKRTSREVLEDAGLAMNAGLQIDLDQLQELTGYTLSKAPETPVQGPFGGLNATTPSKTPLQNAEKALQNAPSPADGQGDEKSPKASEGILEAFAKDTSKAAEAVKTLLADPTPEKAEKLLADLPNLLPDDPALAAVIAEAMAAEFRPAEDEATNSGHPYTKCPDCGKFLGPAGNCEHCGFVEDDDRMIARGKKALERAITGNPRDVPNAMYRKGVGSIAFVQGWEGKGKAMEHGAGLLKIQQKHKNEMAQIPETIAKGTVTPLTVKGKNVIDKDGIAIINGTNIAILSRSKGEKWRLITHYKSDSDAKKITEAAKNATPV